MTPPSALAFSVSLLANAALLLSLTVFLDFAVGHRVLRTMTRPGWLAGVAVGTAGVLLMTISTTLVTGIVFDTRSVLLAVSGLMLGPLPTVIGMAMTGAYRLWMGGSAAWVGVAVIVTSGTLGLAWRWWLALPPERLQWRQVFALGVAVHVVMLALMPALPEGHGWPALKVVALPVLLIYPAFTAALGQLLVDRLQRERDVQALQEREARYRALFDNNHAVMLLVDADSGDIVDANPAAAQYYGWSQAVLRTKNVRDINTLDAGQIEAEMALARQAQRNHFEFRHRRADGSVRDVEVFSGLVHLEGRSYLYSIVHDTSERKAAESALQLAQQRLELALKASRQGIWDLDLRTGQGVVSAEYATMIGHDPVTFRENIGDWLERLHPDDRARANQAFKDATEGLLPEYRIEFRQRTADGRWLWTLSVGQIVERDAQGRPLRMMGTHTDVDERRQAEEELRRSHGELQRFNRAMVGRELDMIALKRQVNALCAELGRPAPYPLHFADETAPDALTGTQG